MEDIDLETLKKFYEEIIKGWMMGDLNTIKDKAVNLITALGCLTYTEAIGLYLPELSENIEKRICNNEQKRFYRCLFRLESREHLMKCDKKIKNITKGNGIYELRNRVVHRYLPNLAKPSPILVEVRGSHNPPGLPFPIFLEENGGRIEKITINNVKYIEELQKLVNDVYNKTFIKEEDAFIEAMRSGYKKLFKDD